MKNTEIIPPLITQYFDSKLLSTPCPLMRETSEDLKYVYEYIKALFLKKTRCGKIPIKKARCETDLSECERLMCEILQKEKELQTKTDHQTQRPFYFISRLSEKDEKIFAGSKRRAMRRSFFTKFGYYL